MGIVLNNLNSIIASMECLRTKVEALENETAKLYLERTKLLKAMIPDHDGALAYVDKSGVVKLPSRIVAALGVTNGGGVSFVEKDGKVEIMSDAEFVSRFMDDDEKKLTSSQLVV